ncbi:hypothetical protein [Phenylobacterium montanum]|uniref:DUF2188 domain-containing protein n=1 Tax=Phenylobacterium montanum TaxID=2823693 RepID=A0A975G2F0_9CAUL|nr:hypothetical protein [Caulobacter sp. S6]QUD89893.1 hypothetical protein KCG34_08525 [Caulobacter sp. S6]
MRAQLERTIFTVMRDGDAWVVEHGGAHFGRTIDKEVAKAFAHKRAREMSDAGGAVAVHVTGEGGFR